MPIVSAEQLKLDEEAFRNVQTRAQSIKEHRERIRWLVDEFSSPLPENDFQDVYQLIFGEAFDMEHFAPYSDFVEIIASIPGVYRQRNEDSDAVELHSEKHLRKFERDAVYQEPPWALNCASETLPTIFQKTKWTLRAFKDDAQIDYLDLKSFIAAFGETPSSYIIFGRGDHVDYLMCHPSISRVHAVLQFDGEGQLFVCDVSTHGTFLNGQRINQKEYVKLERYASLKFGESSREYVLNISRDRSYNPPREVFSERSEGTSDNFPGRSRHLAVVAEETECATSVQDIQQQMSSLDLDGDEEMMMFDDENESKSVDPKRTFVVDGIDFRQSVDKLEKLTVVKLKLYTSANAISLPPKTRKAGLVDIIREDITRFI